MSNLASIQKILWKKEIKGPLSINKNLNADVGVLKIFPGMNRSFIESVLNAPNTKAFIIEAFGTGNVFALTQQFKSVIKHKSCPLILSIMPKLTKIRKTG